MTVSSALAAGTASIGAILAYGYAQQDAVAPAEAQRLVFAFLLCGLFALATILFALGAARKEAS